MTKMVSQKQKAENDQSNKSSSHQSVPKKRAKHKGTSEADLNSFADRVFGGPRLSAKTKDNFRASATRGSCSDNGDADDLSKSSASSSGKSKSKSNKKPADKADIRPENHSFINVFFSSILAIDASLSRLLAICSTPGSLFRPFAIILEWSGHGVPWFFIILYGILYTPLADRQKLYILYNYLFSLILDAISVGLLKSIIKRKRPSYNHSNDMHTFVNADNYSFPSGHASRITLMTYLTIHFFKGSGLPTKILLASWAFWVCLSRVMLGRHYLSDICCGSFLALIIAHFLKRGLFLNDGVVYQLHRIVRQVW